MNNIDQFIDYLLGKAEFPYFKDLPEVPLPRIYQEDPADLAHELEVEHALEAQYYADQAKTEQEDKLPEGIYPDCDPDSTGINMIGDPKNG